MVLSLRMHPHLHLQDLRKPRETQRTTAQKAPLKTGKRQINQIPLPLYLHPIPHFPKMPDLPGQHLKQNQRYQTKATNAIIQPKLIIIGQSDGRSGGRTIKQNLINPNPSLKNIRRSLHQPLAQHHRKNCSQLQR